MPHPLNDDTPRQPERSLADEARALQTSLRQERPIASDHDDDHDIVSPADDDISYDQPSGKTYDEMPLSASIDPQTFMTIMGFDQAAIRANQHGNMTHEQQMRLKQALKSEADSMWLYLTIFIGVSLLIALIMQGSGVPMVYLIIAGVIFFGGFFFLTYRRQTGMTTDSNARAIASETGIIQLEFGGLGEDRRYWLRVGTQKFRLGMHTFRALAEQSHNGYLGAGRIFYAPQS